jgi:hypothetical protein
MVSLIEFPSESAGLAKCTGPDGELFFLPSLSHHAIFSQSIFATFTRNSGEFEWGKATLVTAAIAPLPSHPHTTIFSLTKVHAKISLLFSAKGAERHERKIEFFVPARCGPRPVFNDNH